jgi:hypothetical protein
MVCFILPRAPFCILTSYTPFSCLICLGETQFQGGRRSYTLILIRGLCHDDDHTIRGKSRRSAANPLHLLILHYNHHCFLPATFKHQKFFLTMKITARFAASKLECIIPPAFATFESHTLVILNRTPTVMALQLFSQSGISEEHG